MHPTLMLTLAMLAFGYGPDARQTVDRLPIGTIPMLQDSSASTWGLGGMSMIDVTTTADGLTPISRTLRWDARTVEILSRADKPGLRAGDIAVTRAGGKAYITVRGYLLLEVTREDADAARSTVPALARTWLREVRRVLPQVAPVRSS